MYLLRNAEVYAPAPMGVCDILVCNDKVVDIGKGLAPGISGIKEIDSSGKKILPGFIDQHVHVTGGGGEGGFHTMVPELPISMAVRAGVTTLVGLLGTDSFARSVENLVAKTKALHNQGLTTYCLTGAYRYPTDTVTGSVAKDLVYIDEVIGCKLAISDHRCSHPTKEEIIRLASDIRMASLIAGKPGLLHIHVGATGNGIAPIIDIVNTTDIPIWHFRPTHLGRHMDEAAEFASLGGYADVTAKPDAAGDFRQLLAKAAPGLITLSSDSNGSLPIWNDKKEIIGVRIAQMTTLYEVVRALVLEFGMPLEEAILPITANVAKALQLYPRKGTLAPGCDADLVVLDGQLNIDAVMARGVMMMQEKEVLVQSAFVE